MGRADRWIDCESRSRTPKGRLRPFWLCRDSYSWCSATTGEDHVSPDERATEEDSSEPTTLVTHVFVAGNYFEIESTGLDFEEALRDCVIAVDK